MRDGKASSVEDVQLVVHYERLRAILLSQRFVQHLESPLAHWAAPTDRKLPLALLGKSLKDLLDTPFPELASTPGVGRKKIRSLLRLLGRVAHSDPEKIPHETSWTRGNGKPESGGKGVRDVFDPAAVSEVVWTRWRNCVLRHGLDSEPLGRFSPSLRGVTRGIWKRPLADYAEMSLREVRDLKTHGEKRTRAILEAFHCVHKLTAGMGVSEHLAVQVVPRRIGAVEAWVRQALRTPGIPAVEEILERFIRPLLRQIQVDTPGRVAQLAEDRLGLSGPIRPLRAVAKTLGVTRARVYQLLNEINDVVTVRWPCGRGQVHDLQAKFLAEAEQMDDPPNLRQFFAAVELLYPGRRGVAGPG